MSDRICVAAITGSYGVRGEARVKSFCAEPSALGDYGPLSDDTGTRDFKVTITRPVKGGFAVRLSGVKTKEEADALKGTRLYAPRDVLPALPDDEFYHADLMGLSVVDTGGADLGQVHAVMNHGAGDLLQVRQKGRSGTVLVPFTQAIVPTVDLAAGRIVVDPPEGLFDED
ncbi:ribosome maturation factor RimM [Nioella sp.]|uniref:ribosome maturation factor RimM n=1 Tax=Nioella sp. TaxID=1912091 RepID=UPI003A86FA8B